MLVERFESTAESYWVVVHGAAHDNFTDGPLLLPGSGQEEEHMALIQKYALAFLGISLKGHPKSLMSVSFEREDVSVRVFPPG